MNKINKKELHEIFQGLHNKNQNAYNQLYEKYYKLVYGIVFSIIKNRQDSEDVTHEIFTKIYKIDVNKLPTDHEASWLFTVSKNECLLFLRKSKPNISIDEIYEMADNSNEMDDVIDKDYYNKLVSGLKEDEKIIISLKVLSNFTFSKISQVMNIPIGTVQWKYYKAINSLKISIGSIVGAALAFLIVIARGELWKKEEHFDDRWKNNESTNKNEDVSKTNEGTSSIMDNAQKNDEQVIQNDSQTKEQQENINQETKTGTEVESKPAETNQKTNKLDGIQIAFLTIGIALFVIFIIFFKKYQQKLKKKSSK